MSELRLAVVAFATVTATLLTSVSGVAPAEGAPSSLSLGGQTASVSFVDVTDVAGVAYTGMSWGAAWGDMNADGLPDLFVGNHFQLASLFLNQGNGTFIDTAVGFVAGIDGHGAQWADFDNDADHDLVYVAGGGSGIGANATHLYRNDGGFFTERAAELGVDDPLARARGPLWLDANGDGLLDLLVASKPRNDAQVAPTQLFVQVPPGFEKAEFDPDGPVVEEAVWAQLADLNGDLDLELVLHGRQYPQAVYEIGGLPMTEVDVGLPTTGGANDIVVADSAFADLNGDLLTDLIVVGIDPRSDYAQTGPQQLALSLMTELPASEHGVSFETAGDVTFEMGISFGQLDLSTVYIGSGGINPVDPQFTLSPTDPQSEGIAPHTPGVDSGIYVGFDPPSQTWQVLCSDPDQCQVIALITSTMDIANPQHSGFDLTGIARPPVVYLQGPTGFTEASASSGFDTPADCISVVTGDFDNDMDEDVYLVCTGSAANDPNLLYENLGDGTFVLVPDAGGAAGPLTGKGDTAVTADYDADGDLDLFVTNGWDDEPLNQGPSVLYQNAGNGNHWLEVDLVGRASNRDAIGAVVQVTAGGVTQQRARDGGVHSKAQDHQLLHFGLGPNTVADSVFVRWPTGVTQTLSTVPADQKLTLVEPPVIEVGRVAARHFWRTVTLTEDFVDPVVVVGPASHFEADELTLRVQNVTPGSFQVRIDEWEYLADRRHGPESVMYMVLERGVYDFGEGKVIEAGTAQVNHLWKRVSLTGPFATPPAVFSSLNSLVDRQPAAPRVGAVATDSFDVRLQEQESSAGWHNTETIGYVAWSIGSDPTAQIPWEVFTTSVGDQFTQTGFTPVPVRACVLASINSYNEPDAATLRHRNLTKSGVEIQVDEEQSADAETTHAAETVALVRFDCSP